MISVAVAYDPYFAPRRALNASLVRILGYSMLVIELSFDNVSVAVLGLDDAFKIYNYIFQQCTC